MVRRLALLLVLALPLSAATFKAADGTVLHYEVIGDVTGRGAPVVMLAGGPGFSPGYLEPVARTLRKEVRSVLFHQRGTGLSTMETITAETHKLQTLVADLESLRTELKAEKLTLLGHSFGGILAMMYAAEHPDRVAALVLVDSGGPTLASMPKFVANFNARLTAEDNAKVKEWSDPAKMAENRKRAILEITRARTPAYFADRAKAKRLMDALTEESFNDAVLWAVTPQMMAGLDLREALKGVKAPVLVLHGKQDPLETAEEVHAAFDGAKLVVIDGAGHFPWEEQPEKFFAPLTEFLRILRR
ncbi:MAG TPA: alpha/beta hydrolase [Thermoanaerobaculia bacterium]|nr:alpha/beta hydrolase [Thermoanaerobaculia bacterium]